MAGRRYVALVAFVLAACAGPLSGSPSASSAPTAVPSRGCACIGTPPDPVSTAASRIEHANGPSDLVLRMIVHGWPWPVTVERPAEFSLFGDGRAIYLAERHAPPGEVPVLNQARLSPNEMEELLEFALRHGGLAAARDRYEVPDLVDHDWTVFVINVGGASKEVWVYALGEERAPDAADRVAFERLAGRLNGFANDVASGSYEDLSVYPPEGYAASLSLLRPTSDLPTSAEWPWSDLEPADFDVAPDGTLTPAISAEQGLAVLDLGIPEYLIVEDEADNRYFVRIRPLLPDELYE